MGTMIPSSSEGLLIRGTPYQVCYEDADATGTICSRLGLDQQYHTIGTYAIVVFILCIDTG